MKEFKAPARRRAAFIMAAGGYTNAVVMTIQGLLLVPLYLRFIGSHLYGQWLGSGGILAILGFLDIGLASIIIQRISSCYAKKEYQRVGEYFVNGLIFQTALMLILFMAASALSFSIPTLLRVDAADADILRVSFLLASIGLSLGLLNNTLGGFQRALQYVLPAQISIVTCNLVGLIVTIICLYRGLGLLAIPLGTLTSIVPMSCINLFIDWRLLKALSVRPRVRRSMLYELGKLSPTFLLAKLATSTISQIEPTLITYFSQPEWATAFVITKRATGIIEYCLNTILSSVYPGFSHLFSEDKGKMAAAVFGKLVAAVFALGLVACGTYVAANHSFINLWVGPDQFGGQSLTLLMGIACLCAVLYNLLSYLIMATGDITVPILMTACEAFFRLLLMLILMWQVGLNGFPLAVLASSLLFSLPFYFRTQRQLQLAFFQDLSWIKYPIVTLVVFIAAFGLGSITETRNWFWFSAYIATVSALLGGITILIVPHARQYCVTRISGTNIIRRFVARHA